ESVNFCVMEAIKLCRLDTPIIFIEARINLSRFVVTGCAAKTSATVTFPSLNLISLFAFCFNIWLNGVRSEERRVGKNGRCRGGPYHGGGKYSEGGERKQCTTSRTVN